MLISVINNCVSIIAFKTICGIKLNKKFNNIYQQRRTKKTGSFIKRLMTPKDSVGNISTQGSILQFYILSEWKLINFEVQSKMLNGIMVKNPIIKRSLITCSFVLNIKIKVNFPVI